MVENVWTRIFTPTSFYSVVLGFVAASVYCTFRPQHWMEFHWARENDSWQLWTTWSMLPFNLRVVWLWPSWHLVLLNISQTNVYTAQCGVKCKEDMWRPPEAPGHSDPVLGKILGLMVGTGDTSLLWSGHVILFQYIVVLDTFVNCDQVAKYSWCQYRQCDEMLAQCTGHKDVTDITLGADKWSQMVKTSQHLIQRQMSRPVGEIITLF